MTDQTPPLDSPGQPQELRPRFVALDECVPGALKLARSFHGEWRPGMPAGLLQGLALRLYNVDLTWRILIGSKCGSNAAKAFQPVTPALLEFGAGLDLFCARYMDDLETLSAAGQAHSNDHRNRFLGMEDDLRREISLAVAEARLRDDVAAAIIDKTLIIVATNPLVLRGG